MFVFFILFLPLLFAILFDLVCAIYPFIKFFQREMLRNNNIPIYYIGIYSILVFSFPSRIVSHRSFLRTREF
jgi:hypothetical protein